MITNQELLFNRNSTMSIDGDDHAAIVRQLSIPEIARAIERLQDQVAMAGFVGLLNKEPDHPHPPIPEATDPATSQLLAWLVGEVAGLRNVIMMLSATLGSSIDPVSAWSEA